MFTFTLLGSDEKSHTAEVYQSLLTIDQVQILVDVGWDDNLSYNLDHLVKIAPSINAILLTHATISHLGAYAYLCKIGPEFAQIPVYATLPVINMGKIITLDSYRSTGLLGPVLGEQVTLSDVEAAFDKIEPLKYSQPFSLSGMMNNTTITAYNAGHTLGGTIWRIQKDQENIVYAVDWNQARDTFLNGSSLLEQGKVIESLTRPTALICGSHFGLQTQPLQKRRDSLTKCILDTLKRNGTVIIPTSSGSRVLELMLILENLWETKNITKPLLYYSHVGLRTMSYASSMLEWMSSSIIDEWQKKNSSPFETKYMKVTTDLNEIRDNSQPRVILASSESMGAGFSKQVFAELCNDENNTVLLTEYSSPSTISRELYNLWSQNKRSGSLKLATEMHISCPREEPLDGDQLMTYNTAIKEAKQKQEMQEALEMRNKNLLEQQDDEAFDAEESDSEDEMEFIGQTDTNILLYGKDVYDFDMRNFKGRSRMFPFTQKRQKVDDYGIIVKADDFLRNEAIDDLAVKSKKSGEDDAKVGDKRKWSTETKFGEETVKLDIMSSEIVPQKINIINQDIKVLCSVQYIDFSGLADERSVKEILPSIQPRKLIILPSADGETATIQFKQDIEQLRTIDTVINAELNKEINASINSFVFDVKILPELESLLKWQKIINDYNVAHVTGKLRMVSNEEENNNKNLELVPLETTEELAAVPRTNPLLVGDVKLTELKKKLVSMGHRAEFRAEGVLLCDDKVAVRKIAEGRLVIEGHIDNEFYEIKRILRASLAVV